MRVYHRQTIRYDGSAWVYPVPTATVIVRDVAANVIETIAATYDATYRRLYFNTTAAAGYVGGQIYLAYFAVTYLGTTYTPAPDVLVYVDVVSGDTTPPGVAVIGTPAVTESTAVFSHTPPSDADYDETTVYCIAIDGSGTVAGTGSGTSITVSGLSADTPYIAVAIAADTSGNRSIPGPASTVYFTTANAPTPSNPVTVKVYRNDEGTYHERSPYVIDGARRGGHRLHTNIPARRLRIRIECHRPFDGLEIKGVTITAQPHGRRQPHGLRDPYGN